MLEGSLVEPFALLRSLLPGLQFLAQLHILLLDELHVEGAREVFLFFVPFIEHGIYDGKVQSQVTQLQLGFGQQLLL
jgi:hypothetical protein